MNKNPYAGLPEYQFWKRGGGFDTPEAFDPVAPTSFKISPSDRIVTAGSCFAQHLSRHLAANRFNFLVTERAHPLIADRYAADFYYGQFPARYGNIYTARQLRQLLERSYGLFSPQEKAWKLQEGRWVDPFRPQIQPGGYVSVQELERDRETHFSAVRRAIEQMSVFIFTLGLTEAWSDRIDGAIFPLAPGVAGGSFDPERYAFVNFDVGQTLEDLRWSLNFIQDRNKTVRSIFTVSPVPLNATAVARHVMVSTAYSKAVLRVAAEETARSAVNVDYFPSYEIITNPHVGSLYFEADRRRVTEAGVAHVMRIFFNRYQDRSIRDEPENAKDVRDQAARETVRREVAAMEKLVQTLCDEEAVDKV